MYGTVLKTTRFCNELVGDATVITGELDKGTFKMAISKDSTYLVNLDYPTDRTYYELRLTNAINNDSFRNYTMTKVPYTFYEEIREQGVNHAEKKSYHYDDNYDDSYDDYAGLAFDQTTLRDAPTDFNENGPNYLDLMIIYTYEALSAAGSGDQMANVCIKAVDDFNEALNTSGVSLIVKLVRLKSIFIIF